MYLCVERETVPSGAHYLETPLTSRFSLTSWAALSFVSSTETIVTLSNHLYYINI